MSRTDVLVDADWVEAHLDDPTIVLVEVDEDTSAYDKNHIAGAVKIDWQKDLQDQVRRDFVDKAAFEKLLSGKGIGTDDTIVLYGGNNNWFASYAYWYFKLYGHDKVLLLDGGRKKWELESRALTDAVRSRPATSYTAKEPNNDIRAFRDEVLAAIGQQNLIDVRSPDEFSGKLLAPAHLPQEQDLTIRAFRDDVLAAIGQQNLVDVRSPDEFSGRLLAPAHLPQEQSQRPGHVPTAISVPWS